MCSEAGWQICWIWAKFEIIALKKERKKNCTYVQAPFSTDIRAMHTEATGISQRAMDPKINYWEQSHTVVVIIAIWEIAYLGLSKALPGLVSGISGSRSGPCRECRWQPRNAKRGRQWEDGGRTRESQSEKDTGGRVRRLWSLLFRRVVWGLSHSVSLCFTSVAWQTYSFKMFAPSVLATWQWTLMVSNLFF